MQTFLPSIVQSDINQSILLGMVSFLLDNCEAVFQPPAGLKEEVEELSKLRNSRVSVLKKYIFNACLLSSLHYFSPSFLLQTNLRDYMQVYSIDRGRIDKCLEMLVTKKKWLYVYIN